MRQLLFGLAVPVVVVVIGVVVVAVVVAVVVVVVVVWRLLVVGLSPSFLLQ